MSTVAGQPRTSARELIFRNRFTTLIVFAFSLFYFVDVTLRAGEKYFWYDELLSVYLARLSNLHTLWRALMTAVDSNPPGFHLLTRGVETIFGEGLVSTRLPEIVSFWILSLCLFAFVNRRAGSVPAFVAMSLPMLTGVYFYAYEARPLMVVVALGAVALVCWDNAARLAHASRWLVLFSLALFFALMLHAYAVLLLFPFGLVQLLRDLRRRQVNWLFWTALVLPVVPAIPLYLPMTKAFSAVAKGTDFTSSFPPNWPQVLKFYSVLLLPCLPVLLAGAVFFAFAARDQERSLESLQPGREDLTLSLGFLCLPVLGMFLGQIVGSPYFGRYFLSALIGVVIPFALQTSSRRVRPWVAPVLAGLIALLLGMNFVRLVRHRLQGSGETLFEPSAQIQLATTPGKPLDQYSLLNPVLADPVTAVAVLTPWDYLYLAQYAPGLAPRLYLINSDGRDATFRHLRLFRQLSPLPMNQFYLSRNFVAVFSSFYVYGRASKLEEFGALARLVKINSLRVNGDTYLAKMEANR